MSKSTQPSAPSPPAFVTTQWTRVLQARGDSPEARAALGELCAAYYAPAFAFMRRTVPDEETARDLTQDFFARLLAGNGIEGVDPTRGRFRSFLLGAVKHFLSDRREHDQRLKRGGGRSIESIDSATDTSAGLQIPDPVAPNPEREFDRRWALTLLDRALVALAKEQEAAGKGAQFAVLKPWLTGDLGNISQAEAARELGLNESAVKVAIHRLRRRFREAIKSEISQTIDDRGQLDEELHYLLEALL